MCLIECSMICVCCLVCVCDVVSEVRREGKENSASDYHNNNIGSLRLLSCRPRRRRPFIMDKPLRCFRLILCSSIDTFPLCIHHVRDGFVGSGIDDGCCLCCRVVALPWFNHRFWLLDVLVLILCLSTLVDRLLFFE